MMSIPISAQLTSLKSLQSVASSDLILRFLLFSHSIHSSTSVSHHVFIGNDYLFQFYHQADEYLLRRFHLRYRDDRGHPQYHYFHLLKYVSTNVVRLLSHSHLCLQSRSDPLRPHHPHSRLRLCHQPHQSLVVVQVPHFPRTIVRSTLADNDVTGDDRPVHLARSASTVEQPTTGSSTPVHRLSSLVRPRDVRRTILGRSNGCMFNDRSRLPAVHLVLLLADSARLPADCGDGDVCLAVILSNSNVIET